MVIYDGTHDNGELHERRTSQALPSQAQFEHGVLHDRLASCTMRLTRSSTLLLPVEWLVAHQICSFSSSQTSRCQMHRAKQKHLIS